MDLKNGVFNWREAIAEISFRKNTAARLDGKLKRHDVNVLSPPGLGKDEVS